MTTVPLLGGGGAGRVGETVTSGLCTPPRGEVGEVDDDCRSRLSSILLRVRAGAEGLDRPFFDAGRDFRRCRV